MCSGVALSVGRLEVGVLEEVTAHLRREEHDEREDHQEDDDRDEILGRVIRMERDAVERHAVLSLVLLDLDAVRVVRADFVQRDDVHEHERDQRQRQRNNVQCEEPV